MFGLKLIFSSKSDILSPKYTKGGRSSNFDQISYKTKPYLEIRDWYSIRKNLTPVWMKRDLPTNKLTETGG